MEYEFLFVFHCITLTIYVSFAKENDIFVEKRQFLPRDAVHRADYAFARCLSVCLSVTLRYSVETVQHVIKRFHHRVGTRHTILVFAASNTMSM